MEQLIEIAKKVAHKLINENQTISVIESSWFPRPGLRSSGRSHQSSSFGLNSGCCPNKSFCSHHRTIGPMPGPIAWKKSLWSHLHNLDCEPDREACLILSATHHPGFSQDQARNLRSGWAERHKPFPFHPPSADSKRTEPKLGRKDKNAFFVNQLRCNGFFQKE